MVQQSPLRLAIVRFLWKIANLQRNRILSLLALFSFSLLIVFYSKISSISIKPIGGEFIPNFSACEFPIFDPFDSTILKYVEHPQPLNCPKVQPEFITELFGDILLNETLINEFNNVTLNYSEIIFNPMDIENRHFTDWKPMPMRLKLKRNTIVAGEYLDEKGMLRNYSMIYAFVPHELNKSKITNQNKTEKFNIMLFELDSLSRPNFIRNLPKTYEFLTETLEAVVLQKYNKIGENTFSNTIGLLTGRKANSPELLNIYLDCIPSVLRKGCGLQMVNKYPDNYPLIWRNFSQHGGYVTAWIEEELGNFSAFKKELQRLPFDIFVRPFGIDLVKEKTNREEPYCMGNQPEIEYSLNTIRKIAFNKNLHPYFLISFSFKISHDFTSEIEKVDSIILKHFQELYTGGALENTILIVQSDHGNRYDEIRETLIGRWEERMPFIAIYLPPIFRKLHAAAFEALKLNADRLTAVFDVYETLNDISSENFGRTEQPTFKNRGKSLFRPISDCRTCDDLEIPLYYCLCQQKQLIQNSSSILVQYAARIALKTILRALRPHERKCAKLKLTKILHAQKLKTNQLVLYNSRFMGKKFVQDHKVTDALEYYRVTFETSPGGAIFEALTKRSIGGSGKFSVKFEDINRINAEENTGKCIAVNDDRKIKKFCSCIH